MPSRESKEHLSENKSQQLLSLQQVLNGIEETPLFDASLLGQIDWESRKSSYKNGISPTNPGESLSMRPLCIADYDKGFLQLLSQLTSVGDISKEKFMERFESMKNASGTYYITVIEDLNTGGVIGAASLIVEQKFIHTCAKRGRIEDVVVNTDYRGKQLGKLLVESMTLLGKLLGCYKMSLECTDDKIPFYQSFGYDKDGNNFLVQRFKE